MSRRNIGLGLLSFMTMFAMTAKSAPQINLGNLPAGKKVSISYDVTINTNASGNQISSQALVTGANFADVSSDDPDTATLNDATISTVDEADTTLQLIASDATPTTSENVTFTATVDTTDGVLATPTGNVEFRIDGGSATVVALNASGSAVFNTAFTVGSYNLSADYVGNAENKPSANNVAIVVSPGSTTTSITSVSPNSIQAGDSVTVSFDVNSSITGLSPTGTVTVSDGTDSCAASVAVGSCNVQFATEGSKSVIATFTSNNSNLGGSVSTPVTVEVLEAGAPLTRDDMVNVNEDEATTFNPLANDRADEGFDFSTLEIVQSPSSGVLEVDAVNGLLTYRGGKDFNGTETAQYQIMDNAGEQSNASSIEFTVNPVNDAPKITSEPTKKVVESTAYSYQLEASDAEGQFIQYTAIALPAWLQLVGDQLMGTPLTADLGQHDITIQASDGLESVQQSFKVNVVSFNSNDVAITQAVGTIAPLVGEEFILTYNVMNSGPTATSTVDLTADIDGDVTLSTNDSRCTINASNLVCNLPTIEPNAEESIELAITGNVLGDIYSYAKLSSVDDEVSANNESGLGVSITNETMADKAYTIGEAGSAIGLSGDINNNGYNDIVLMNGANGIGSVFINEGFYSFSKVSDIQGYETVKAAKLVDIDNDNFLDLVVATEGTEYTLIYVGNGDGTFRIKQTLSAAETHAIDVKDIDGDGAVDLVLANQGPNQVYLNQNGMFQLSHELGNTKTLSVKLADADGDGLMEALFAEDSGDGHYYSNAELLNSVAPGSSFSTVYLGAVVDIDSVDVNDNGRSEFVVALMIDTTKPQDKPENKILEWNSGLSVLQAFGAVDSRQVIASDIDSDGDQDLFIRNASGAHQIYFNQNGNFAVTNKLLINGDSKFASWVYDETGVPDLLLAESLDEGSALYANQGDGNFGVAETDLALTYTANVSTVTTDGVIEAQLKVVNYGPSSAQSVTLSATINSRLNVIRFGSGSEGCTVSDSALSCDIDTLMPSDSVMIPLRLVAMNTGEAVIRAEVSSPIDDLNPSNNTQEVRINVTEKKDSGGGQVGLVLLLLLMLAGVRRRKYCK